MGNKNNNLIKKRTPQFKINNQLDLGLINEWWEFTNFCV